MVVRDHGFAPDRQLVAAQRLGELQIQVLKLPWAAE